MTPRERLFTVLKGDIPDCVPAAPDFSNMIPAKLTGKPFWDLYLYKNKPIWEAYIDCAKFFNIDALMDAYCPLIFPEEIENEPDWETAIIKKTNEVIITQDYYKENGKFNWKANVAVYYRNDPPTRSIAPSKLGLPDTPDKWEPLEGVRKINYDTKYLKEIKTMMGDQGLVGISVASTCALLNQDDIFNYYDNPDKHEEWAAARVDAAEKRFERIMRMETKPDFICVGGSGTLIFQTPEIFRQLAFPAVKKVIELATESGIPTHVHSCGPEKELIKIMAEETSLSIIDPLEIPPMGNCDLKELKKLYGNKITLKGNLHTTDVMLNGSVDDVVAASKKAIDDGAKGGRFILSTGDQCGRDTPFENLEAMIETARTYGKY